MNPPSQRNEEKGPTSRSRSLALFVGSCYLVILSEIFSNVSDSPLRITMPLVLLGAFMIVAVFAVLAGRHVRNDGQSRRFGLSSILLLFIPASIYLAAVRILLTALPKDPPILMVFIIVVATIVLVALSTVVFLRMAEAGMWFALQILRLRISWQKQRSREKEGTQDARNGPRT